MTGCTCGPSPLLIGTPPDPPPPGDTVTITVTPDGFTLDATANITGEGDAVTVTVDWGDGTPPENFPVPSPGPWAINEPHTYAQPGTYTVTATYGPANDTDTVTVPSPIFESAINGTPGGDANPGNTGFGGKLVSPNGDGRVTVGSDANHIRVEGGPSGEYDLLTEDVPEIVDEWRLEVTFTQTGASAGGAVRLIGLHGPGQDPTVIGDAAYQLRWGVVTGVQFQSDGANIAPSVPAGRLVVQHRPGETQVVVLDPTDDSVISDTGWVADPNTVVPETLSVGSVGTVQAGTTTEWEFGDVTMWATTWDTP